MDALYRKRTNLNNKFKVFHSHVQSVSRATVIEEHDVEELNFRLNKVECFYETFNEIQTQIDEEVSLNELDKEYQERTAIETLYFSSKGMAKSIITKFTKTSSVQSVSGSSSNSTKLNVKLPLIQIPKFSGDADNWLEFRDTFVSLIHDSNELDDIEKFHYLRSSLSGKASECIKNMVFSANNYNAAWEAICDRFNNKRNLIFTHIQAIFTAESVSKESSLKLRALVDCISKNLRSLKSRIADEQLFDNIKT